MSLLKMSTASVGYKLHAMILSAAASTPFLNFGYHYKNYDFAKYLGLERYVLHGHNKSEWHALFEQMMAQQADIRRLMDAAVVQARSDYNQIFDSLGRFLRMQMQ